MILKLTKSQVGALKECIDFLANGYVIRWSFIDRQEWVISLVHTRNGKKMNMIVRKDVFKLIVPNGDTRLQEFPDCCNLFDFNVDSQVIKTYSESWESLRQKLIFASEVGYINVARNQK